MHSCSPFLDAVRICVFFPSDTFPNGAVSFQQLCHCVILHERVHYLDPCWVSVTA